MGLLVFYCVSTSYKQHHQNVLHKGRSFTANSGTKAEILPKGRSSTANSGAKVIVLLKTYTQIKPIYLIIRVFCPRAGLSLLAEASRQQFCPKAGLPPQTQEPRLQFYQELKNYNSFPHPTLSLASGQILKDLKRFQGHHRGGKQSGFG